MRRLSKKNRNLPSNALIYLVGFFAIVSPSPAEEQRMWTSKDGRTISAKGLHISLDGVAVQRDGAKPTVIPFTALSDSDVEYALEELPAFVNDDVRVAASTRKQVRDSFERETGNYAVSFTGYAYGNGSFSGVGTASPITETVKESGRIVEVQLSSMSGPGVSAIEFYTITGQGPQKKIDSVSTGVYSFQAHGSKLLLETTVVEDFTGWVVVARSPNSGKIVDVAGSMTHFEDYVESQVPEVVTLTSDDKAIREMIRNSMSAQ